MTKLDYSITSPEERRQLVEEILREVPDPPNAYLETLADYLVFCMEKQEKKERKLITDNRLSTIGKRETSLEGLVTQMQSGEDGLYNLIANDKNIIFRSKISITKKDLDSIPPLRQLREAINLWDSKLKQTSGRDAFTIKKALIEMRKDQYIIKTAYRKPILPTKLIKSLHETRLEEDLDFTDDGFVIPRGVSLMSPTVISAILCNYSSLKQGCYGDFNSDLWCLLESFDVIADAALKDYPIYERLVTCKVDGLKNIQIQKVLIDEFGIYHSIEYISSLWRRKIPRIIASAAEDDYLSWHFLNIQKGHYKRCSCCGQIKLAHNKYFSKNNTSKDGFYSICKKCRNAKRRKKWSKLPAVARPCNNDDKKNINKGGFTIDEKCPNA